MYKYVIVAGAVVAGLAFTGTDSSGDRPAEKMEKVLAPIIPKDLGDGFYIESAKAEGDVLVIGVEVPMNPGLTSSEIAAVSLAGFCTREEGATRYFAEGGKLRFDVSTGGGTPEQGPVADGCDGLS